MMSPFDTALLKHQPDHLRPLTEAERNAALVAGLIRPSFRGFLARMFAFATRYRRAFAPQSLADASS
jgi:hypothetical protein